MRSAQPFEIVGNKESIGPFVFSCEHAHNHLPAHLNASASDKTLLDDHWGSDIGAADVSRRLVSVLGGQAILGGFSRLVIDLNRAIGSPDLFLIEADGVPISFNQNLGDEEREARHVRVYAPYHEALEDLLATRRRSPDPVILTSVHSFTATFRGARRQVEIGVLFDEHDDLANRLAADIGSLGFDCRLNEPYSGKPPQGLIFSAASHGRSQSVPYVELEIRQDLIDTPEKAAAIADRLVGPLRALAEK